VEEARAEARRILGELWAVRIAETESKNGRVIDAVLPMRISECITRHVDVFRSLFLGSTNHKGLWCSSCRGEALTDAGLYMAVRKRVGQRTGHWRSEKRAIVCGHVNAEVTSRPEQNHGHPRSALTKERFRKCSGSAPR
jgi:hypothetical protein